MGGLGRSAESTAFKCRPRLDGSRLNVLERYRTSDSQKPAVACLWKHQKLRQTGKCKLLERMPCFVVTVIYNE